MKICQLLTVLCLLSATPSLFAARTACDVFKHSYTGTTGRLFGGRHIASLSGSSFVTDVNKAVRTDMFSFFKEKCRVDMTNKAFTALASDAYKRCNHLCFDDRVKPGDKQGIDKSNYCDELCAEFIDEAQSWFTAFQAGKASCSRDFGHTENDTARD